jgi:nucleotide-binding universal stress UspA family protein
MRYATLMVHLALGQSNAGLLQLTGRLAERFHAGVVGIVACQPLQIAYGDGYVDGELIAQDRLAIAQRIASADAEFHALLDKRVGQLGWRAQVVFAALADALACEARCADLLVTGLPGADGFFDTDRALNLGDLVMQLGRPVLVVPPGATGASLTRALVAWRDNGQSRRAVADALPLLLSASHVTVAELVPEAELAAARLRLDDVVRWLAQHGVAARALAVSHSAPAFDGAGSAAPTDDDGSRLLQLAVAEGADLIVAGAYGHSRLREWALGGVTRSLLQHPALCALLSH